MPTLNKDGSTRKKYTTKKMIIAKNRKLGQKKAWDKRRELYPETNGYKPKRVEIPPNITKHLGKVQPKGDKFRGYEEEAKVNEKPVQEEPAPKEEVDVLTTELAQKLSDLDDFLNSIPGVEFNREEFIREALITAVETVLQGVAVVCHGQEELSKKLKSMMEFVEGA